MRDTASPKDLQEPLQDHSGHPKNSSQLQGEHNSPMVIEVDQPPGAIEQSLPDLPVRPEVTGIASADKTLMNSGVEKTEPLGEHSGPQTLEEGEVALLADSDDSDDSGSMTRVTRQEPGLQTWPTISSRGSYAGQISDHYEDVGDNIDDDDDEDEEEDDDEDEEDDDEGIEDDDDDDDEIGFSDDSEEFSEGAVENKAFYKQSPAQDPQLDYLKGTQMTGMTRHQQFRPNYARKRQKAKTGAGKGARFRITNRSGGAGGFSSDASASVDTDISSEEQLFIQTCDEVTRLLLHGVGTMQQGLEYIISLVEFALQWRLEGTLSQDCPFTTNSLPLVEGAYLGAWAKVLIDHRRSSQIPSATMYLQLFVQHGCLILKQENVLPEHYALAMSMVLDKRDMDAFRRNSKRASRLSNSDRVSRFEDHPDFGYDEIDNSQLQQELRKVFTLHNGPEIFFKAIENQLSSDGRHDTKIRNLQLTLGVLSKSQLPTESDGQNEAQVAEAVTRLTTIVLDFFPDHLDAFKSVNKVAVVDIISHVGCLVLEIYRASTSFLTGSSIGSDSSMLREFDPSLDDFDHYDYHHRPQLSKSTLLGEVKFAEFRLEMAVRLMNTSRLDLRLAGLVELKEVLVRIQRLQHGISEVGPGGSRIRRRSDSDMEILQEQDKKPVENLCEKLKSLQIVGYFFGSNIHLELVQRSTDVLVFLVQINALTVQDIDLIWAAVGGNQHRSIVYGVYQVLSDLCSKIPQKFIHNLFEKLQAVPSESWDQQLVDLARALFQAMVQRSKYNPEEGSVSLIPYQTLLNVLRNSAMPINGRDDPSFGNTMTISPDVISGIAFLLSEGIRVGPPSLEDRATLVNQCLSDLGANHPGAVWSLQVLQHIFEHHFGDETEAQEFYTRACSSLPELYISNLQHYATAVKKLPPTPSPTVTSFAPLSTLLVSHEYFKNMQLKIRLGFLRVISRIVPVFWNSPELADTLWSNLIVDPIGPTEQDEAFQCLEAMSEPNFVEYVYDRLLPTLDVITITEKGWNCVRQYFLLVNWHRGNLIVKSEQVVHASQQIVVLAPLYGMEVIWKVALRARPPIVGHLATELLTSIMKTDASQEDSSSRVGVYEFREGLVETCVEHLVQSSDLLGDSNSMETSEVSLVFERCISILKSFLVACTTEGDTGRAGREIHGTLDEGSMLSIQINSNLPLFRLSVHPSATLFALKKIIALRFGCSEPEEVRVFSLGKDLIPAWDHKTLEELQVDDGQTFLATKRPKQAIPPKRIVPKKRLPTDLLHQSEFFERVRQIFLLDEKYASQAWEIVARLPTSPALLQSFEELETDIDWSKLLDSRSPFLLLYSLQILDSLIKRDQDNSTPSSQTWIQKFLELGGLQHLIGLLMSDSGLGSSGVSLTARKALALLLGVFVRLTRSAAVGASLTELFKEDGSTIPDFVNKLVNEILNSAVRDGGQGTNDQSIVLNATCLISYFCEGPRGWQYFQAGSNIRSLIYVSMIQSESVQIRETVLEMGRKFCLQKSDQSSEVSPVMFFLEIMRSFLPISSEYESNCSEFFEFFEIIAREAINYCDEEYFETLYTKLVETITHHQSSEDEFSSKEDTVLIGMIKVATAMIGTDRRLKSLDPDYRFVNYIFDECLFPPTEELEDLDPKNGLCRAKCQSDPSRAAALAFLEEFANGQSSVLRYVIEKTHEHFDRDSEMGDHWGYNPQMIKRARCGFVGLQNLGATCYVNSITQQFFMNKSFRSGILDVELDASDEEKQDTLLFQLQVLFGHLQESIKRSYNAHSFCYAYKDWDGNPMNVAVQMDVDEFFNILFDRLENSVKGHPQEELFKEQYGGKLVQQIKSKDCEHISERQDSFFAIQCEVKNKKTLEESLQLYVQGEILDGDNKYKCSSCDKHVDAIKRACIKELPRNLILHLKRFDYDMDTMRRIKINDRFEFPMRLDMEPYTLDYLTRKEQAQEGTGSSPSTFAVGSENNSAFQYNLVGVLVHTGTADSGHYYSFIKDRSSGPTVEELHSPENAAWYHFNDSKVEEFDPSDIPAKAFGGQEFIPSDSPYMKGVARSMVKPYSAYMLFYQRVEQPPQELETVGEVPSEIKEVVAQENKELQKDLAVFDRQYYGFVWDLFNLFERAPGMDDMGLSSADSSEESLSHLSMRYGLDFFFGVLIHARDVDTELQQWVRFLSAHLAVYPDGCLSLIQRLNDHPTLLLNVLLYCPITQVREAVIELAYEGLEKLREHDRDNYGLVKAVTPAGLPSLTNALGQNESYECAQDTTIYTFIRALQDLLPDARSNWRNFDEYFRLLYKVTQLGFAERACMVQSGFIADLVEFYVSDERNDTKKKKMGDKFTKPSFRHLLLTIQALVLSCDISASLENMQRNALKKASSARSGHRSSSSVSSSASSAHSSPIPDEMELESETRVEDGDQEKPKPLILLQSDLQALFYTHGAPGSAAEKSWMFMTKMIQDRVDRNIISAISVHLAGHGLVGNRLLESLTSCLDYATDDQFNVILFVFKSVVQVADEHLDSRADFILKHLLKMLENSPQPSVANHILDFFRTISDFGQCGRYTQAWLLQNSKVWLQELLLLQMESETRLRARLFFMELLSSERAFNGWNDEQSRQASAQHFSKLLELMRAIPQILSYSPMLNRRDEDEGGWKFVDYFKALSELVTSDTERDMFMPYWATFVEVVSRVDSQQLPIDFDKKEMMILWGKLMNENRDRNLRLAGFKQLGQLLRRFYVCLHNNVQSVQFHRDLLPIYFGLVLRFCRLLPSFHLEWVQCHNYSWAIGAMKWGDFSQHCPEALDQLLAFTLSEYPQFRQECWRNLPAANLPRFAHSVSLLARATFKEENETSGALFFRNNGLVHVTEAIKVANSSGTVTSDNEFFAVEALSVLEDYLCKMNVCRNKPYTAEAIDHWTNIADAITLLTGNLMWPAPAAVFRSSLRILQEIVKETTALRTSAILSVLDTAHIEWRDSMEASETKQAQIQSIFGGDNSPFCQFGVVDSLSTTSGASLPPMRIGPAVFVDTSLFKSLGKEAIKSIRTEWLEPYWELSKSVCQLDGEPEHCHKAIELAALMAMEQLVVGSTTHLEVLFQGAELALQKNDDMVLSLQNPYVVLLMERLLRRKEDDYYLETLEGTTLSRCKTLFGCVSASLDDGFVAAVTEESLLCAEHILEGYEQTLLLVDCEKEENKDASEMEVEPKTVDESSMRNLVTYLQNITILGIDPKDPESGASARLRRLQERLHACMPLCTFPLDVALAKFLPQAEVANGALENGHRHHHHHHHHHHARSSTGSTLACSAEPSESSSVTIGSTTATMVTMMTPPVSGEDVTMQSDESFRIVEPAVSVSDKAGDKGGDKEETVTNSEAEKTEKLSTVGE